jgi:hypothetical protein
VIKDSDFVSFDAFLKAKDGPTPKVGTPGIMYKSIIDIAIVYSNVTFEWSTITVKNGEIDRVNGWYKTQSTADEAAEAVKDVPCIMDHIHNEITPTRPHQFTK